MKFDRETIVVMLVAGLLILGWTTLYPRWNQSRQESRRQEMIQQQEREKQQENLSASAMKKTLPPPEKPKLQASAGTAEKTQKASGKVLLQNDRVCFEFLPEGMIGKVILKKIYRANADTRDTKKIPVEITEISGFEPFSVAVPPDIGEFRFEGASHRRLSETSLEFTKNFSGNGVKLSVVQTFVLGKENSLKCVMVLHSDKNMTLPRLIVWGGALDPLKQMSGDEIYDSHQLEYYLTQKGKAVTVDPKDKPKDFAAASAVTSVDWVAASNKYFLSMLISTPAFTGGCELLNPLIPDSSVKDGFRRAGYGGVYRNIVLQKDVPQSFELTLYAGPKDMSQMQELPESAFYAIHLASWSWLEPVCRPMLWMLNKLKDLTGSYGLAIILLTVIVKLILWPLIHKGNKSMRKLQRIQPQLQELKAKYKDQPQEFQRRMMELYSKNGVSPVGGCFPMLLQFPVFIALYYTLASAIELRQVPFLWAADLSRPDLVGPTIFGIGLHPLILISTGLMVLQQKLSPPVGDPTQRKMMMIMPVAMLIFLYTFPSGLALYWCVNNILSILQMLYSQHAAKKEEELLDKQKTA